MKQTWKFVLVMLVGLCVGAALDETLHMIRDRKAKAAGRDSNEVFQRRLQCKHLADDYVKKNSDNNSTLFLDRVDFSLLRHSCIVAVTRATSGKRSMLYSYEAVDIITAETLFSSECDGNDANSRIFCGNGRNVQLMEKRDKTLEAALSKSE